jgi:Tat protein secretion system quality control protein TatD with DNase activity
MIISTNLFNEKNISIENLKNIFYNNNFVGLILFSNYETLWNKNIFYCRKYSDINFTVRTTIGIHPKYSYFIDNNIWINFEKLLLNNKVVAIGLTGLDINLDILLEKQIEIFITQIEFSYKYNLPMFVFYNDIFDLFYNLLYIYKQKYPTLQIIIYNFKDNLENLKKLIELDFYIGLSFIIKNYDEDYLIKILEIIPFDKIIIEFDDKNFNYDEFIKNVSVFYNILQKITNKNKINIFNNLLTNSKKLFGFY